MTFQPGEAPPKAGETQAPKPKPAPPAKPKHRYEFTIMNPALVPPEFLKLDDEALAAHYDAEKAKQAEKPQYRIKPIAGIHVAEKITEGGD